MSDQLVAETSTWQHTTLTTDKHPCPRWDSNPQNLSRRAAVDLRLRPHGRWDQQIFIYYGQEISSWSRNYSPADRYV